MKLLKSFMKLKSKVKMTLIIMIGIIVITLIIAAAMTGNLPLLIETAEKAK